MAVWKFVINDPSTRKSYQLEYDQSKAVGLIGRRIGEEINGDIMGLSGYLLKITGGTDDDGFPMHPSVKGPGRKKVLLAGPPGFHPHIKGQRKRKTVRGDTISESITQINLKVVKSGVQSLSQLLPSKKIEKPGEVKEKPKEPKEKKKEEIRKESKGQEKEIKEKSTEQKIEKEEKRGGEESKEKN